MSIDFPIQLNRKESCLRTTF